MLGWRRHSVAWLALAVAALGFTATNASATNRTADVQPDPAAPAQATITPGHIKVRGRVFYIDRSSDRNHPAAGLRVEIYDKDERAFGAFELLDTTETDAKGFFSSKEIDNADPDGPTGQLEGTQDIFIKIYTDNGTVRVFETGTSAPFSWTSYQIDERDGLLRNVKDGDVGMPPLYVMENTRNVEALWTYVNLVEGWLFMQQQVGDPGPVTAYWSPTSQDGPRYDPQQRAIYLRDADAGFSDVVVQQEAYALLHNAYGTLPPEWTDCMVGPLEGLKQPSSSAACAFVGGFATFYPTAVYAEPFFESLALRALDIDAPTWGSVGWAEGDRVAGRIAGAFWDLYENDTTEEQYDRYNSDFASIWHAMAQRRPARMSEWWRGWLALGNDGCAALGSLYQNTIDYNTPLRLSTIPTIEMDEDTVRTVDLKDYVDDTECPDDSLTYEITRAGADEVDVVIVPTGVMSITPQANWFGETTVEVSVSDGPSTVKQDVRIVVHSINDCPEITPPIRSVEVRHYEKIVLNLLGHARDVEDAPYQLKWDAELNPQDEADVTIVGRGTTTLEFTLNAHVVGARNIRALITVEDLDGCVTKQPVSLSWAERPNKPPIIWMDRLTREYVALVNTDIIVDLTGVADDEEDGEEGLEWRVVNELEKAGWGWALPDDKQILRFRPHPDYIGSQVAELQVADSDGAIAPMPPATVGITLTWVSQEEYDNLPPLILKNKLRGKTVGKGATACYELLDKAYDPDDPLSSLRWYVTDFDDRDVVVTGQGTHNICISPAEDRLEFEGCLTHEFVVQDPWNAESDPHDVTTCWRTIRNHFPYAQKGR